MTDINMLNSKSKPVSDDLVPIYDSESGRTRNTSVGGVVERTGDEINPVTDVSSTDDDITFKYYNGKEDTVQLLSEATDERITEAQSTADEALEGVKNFSGVPLNGGVWAAGQTFTAYNQYMIYNGTPYAPLASTPLPYGPVGAAPDIAFVGPYPLNDHSKLSNLNSGHQNLYKSTFKNDSFGSAIENMIAGRIDGLPIINHSEGNIYSTGGESWRHNGSNIGSESINDFTALSQVGLLCFGAVSGDQSFDNSANFAAAISSGLSIKDSGDFFVGSTVDFNNPCSFTGDIVVKPNSSFTGDNLAVVTSSNVRLKITLDGLSLLPRFSVPYIGGVPFVGACIVVSPDPTTPITGSSSKGYLDNIDLGGITTKNSPNSGMVLENLTNSNASGYNSVNTSYDEEMSAPAATFCIGSPKIKVNNGNHSRIITSGLGNAKDITINNCSGFECNGNATKRTYSDSMPVVEHGFHTHVFVKSCVGGEVAGNKGFNVGVGVKVESDCEAVSTHDNYYEDVYDYGILGQGHNNCDYVGNTANRTRRFGMGFDVHSPSNSKSESNRIRGNKVLSSNSLPHDGLSSDNRASYLIRGIAGLDNIKNMMTDNTSNGSTNCSYGLLILTDNPESSTTKIKDLTVKGHEFTGEFSSSIVGLSGDIDGVTLVSPKISSVTAPTVFSKPLFDTPIKNLSFIGALVSEDSAVSSIIQNGTYSGSLIVKNMVYKSALSSFTLRLSGCNLDDFVYSSNDTTQDSNSNIYVTGGSVIERISLDNNGCSHSDDNPFFFRVDDGCNFGSLSLRGNSHRGRARYEVNGGSGKLLIADNSATVTSLASITNTLSVTGYIGYNNLTENPKVSHSGSIPVGIETIT